MADEKKPRRGRAPLREGVRGTYTPRLTPERAAVGRETPPIDEADAEVRASLQENRPVDIERAFPAPPPAIAQQEADGAVRPPVVIEEPEILDEVQQTSNEVIRRRRNRLSLPEPEAQPPPPVSPDATPAQRLAHVDRNANEYLQEFRLKLVHRLLMRNVPLDMIANQLGISMRQTQNLRTELHRRLVYESQTINRYEIAGKTMSFYDEVQGMALRMADAAEAKPYVKLQALQTALSAQADRQRFLVASGFWANAPFVPQDASEDEASRSVTKLHSLIEAVMSNEGEYAIDEAATTEQAVQSDMDGKLKLL